MENGSENSEKNECGEGLRGVNMKIFGFDLFEIFPRNSVGALDRLIFRINYAVCKLILRDDGRRLLPIEISQSRPRNRTPLFDFLKGNERLALTISENRGGQEKKKK